MDKIKEAIYVWRKVFGNFNYVLLGLVFGFAFYLVNGLVAELRNAFSVYDLLGFGGTLRFLFVAVLSFVNRLNLMGVVGVLLLSLLFGMLISLLIYRFYSIDKKTRESFGFAGGFGVLLGIAAPGCVACGVGILSLIGLTSALAVLPFKGNEIIVLAVFLVGFAVVNISRKLYNPICRVDVMKSNYTMKGGSNRYV